MLAPSKGFTLIELMVVVAIIAILAAIALPQYQNYVMRSQITRVVAELTNLRQHVEPCINDGWLTIGEGAHQCDISFINSNLLAAEPTISLGATGSIASTMGGDAIAPLHGTAIVLQRTAEGSWQCFVTTGVSASHIPSGCQAR